MMIRRLRSWAKVAVLLLLVGGLLAPVAQARKGFWFGVGEAQQTAGGDLDGTSKATFIDSTQTEAIVGGKLESGTGLAATFGFGVNDYLGVEALAASTRHTATSSLITPQLDTKAQLTSVMAGLRATIPSRNKGSEWFFRGLVGTYSATYDDYGLQGALVGNQFVYTSTNTATFSGTGGAVGLGFELFFGNVGLSLGYTYSQATFDTASSGSGGNMTTNAKLSKSLNVPITTIDLLLNYHVKDENAP